MKPNWLIVVQALETFQTGIFPAERYADENEMQQIEAYVTLLRREYEAHKWEVGFQVAAWRAKVTLLEHVTEAHSCTS